MKPTKENLKLVQETADFYKDRSENRDKEIKELTRKIDESFLPDIIELREHRDELVQKSKHLNALLLLQRPTWASEYWHASINFVRCQIMGGSASMCSSYELPKEVTWIWKKIK